jgi:ligand-binding sensor domain-containing protein
LGGYPLQWLICFTKWCFKKIALSIPSTSIESIIETSGGFIWVATFENGILKMDKSGKILNIYSTTNKNLEARQFTFVV